MIDIESIRKRHEALTAPTGQAHARAVMKRHAPDDIAYLLGEVERLTAENEQLQVQLAGCAVAALDGSEAQEVPSDGYGWSPAYRDVLALRRCMESVRAAIGVTITDYEAAGYDAHAATLARLSAALTTAKDEERAAVVAWLRGEAHFTDVGPLDTFADAYADGIEAGRHREKA